MVGAAGNNDVTESGQCLTDTFSISNQETVPVICGTNSGEHGEQILILKKRSESIMTNFCYTFISVYFDANDNCNDLNFQFGSTLLGQAAKATRQFDIKISQISCK